MKRWVPTGQPAALAGLFVCLAWCGGCGPGAAPTGSVSGKVTYEGQPVTAGFVLFVNEETGVGASAEIDSSGNYRIPSIRTGEYNVALGHPTGPGAEEMEEMEEDAQVAIPRLDVPDKFLNPQTSGLTVTVEKGNNTADFSL